jgi:hypothetical protein
MRWRPGDRSSIEDLRGRRGIGGAAPLGIGGLLLVAALSYFTGVDFTSIIQKPIDPFFINQPSELMMRSSARTDFVIQRLAVDPGPPGGWHTHPGPSFAIVEQGQVMITRYSKKDGCVSTVYGPGEPAGQTYVEVAGEVHRATVLGSVQAVEYKARFYVPLGGALGTPAADPGCT